MVQEGFKRKLTAILSADVEGYSRLMGEDEEATIRTLTTYRSATAKLIQQYWGRIVDSPGDNILSEFDSVVEAVNCAVEIQRELAGRNAGLPSDRKMKFRIGINVGDVVQEGERIYGEGVNIAARVESLSQAGGICISGRAYDQVLNKLGLGYENLGEHKVKNIKQPIRVYRVLSFPDAASERTAKAKQIGGRIWLKSTRVIPAVIILAIISAIIWNFYFRSTSSPDLIGSEKKSSTPLSIKPAIAILPFDNLNDESSQEYFVDGMTDDIITDLSKLSGLLVIARNSSFIYKGRPVKVQQVAKDLSVQYVLEKFVNMKELFVRLSML